MSWQRWGGGHSAGTHPHSAVTGYVPSTSRQYRVRVTQTDVQLLLGADAGLPSQPRWRRRRIMEELADMVVLEKRAGETIMRLWPRRENESLLI